MHLTSFRVPVHLPPINLFTGELDVEPAYLDRETTELFDRIFNGRRSTWRDLDRTRAVSRCTPRRTQRRSRSSHRTVARAAQRCSTSSDPDGEPPHPAALAADGGWS